MAEPGHRDMEQVERATRAGKREFTGKPLGFREGGFPWHSSPNDSCADTVILKYTKGARQVAVISFSAQNLLASRISKFELRPGVETNSGSLTGKPAPELSGTFFG